MNLIATAERLAAIDLSNVTLDPARCLHAVDKHASCEACHNACPAGAIRPGKPPVFNQDRCQKCLACLPACPTGAYVAGDSAASLLKCAARVEARSIELVCERCPGPELGLPGTSVAIRVRGCLAGLGTGAYLALIALGMEKIHLRAEACSECAWGKPGEHVNTQVERAQMLLAPHRLAGSISIKDSIDKDLLSERLLLDAHNPPLTRRDLFRFASLQGQRTAALILEGGKSASGRRPGLDRLRTVNALSHLPAVEANRGITLDGHGYAALTIGSTCTACRACSRACPTGALRFETGGETSFRLHFSPQACIGCEVCLHVCAYDAITINHAPAFGEVFGDSKPGVLFQGAFKRCKGCNSLFASDEGDLCPMCVFRRRDPFGSVLPAGIMREDEA